MPGVIAIVGRPNVGKSALFNRIAGRRIAIVHDMPGVTRDRVSAEVEWEGYSFTLLDTGGIGLLRGEKTGDLLVQAASQQVRVAIESANVILHVVDVREGCAPLDVEVAGWLRRAGKPVLVAANKADHPGLDAAAADFAELGFEQIFPVSAAHGRGIGELMSAALEHLPPVALVPVTGKSDEKPPLKIAIVGRPNVGKSSLVNALTQSERVIVSPIPGTTRDAVDVPFEIKTEKGSERYVLIDTAGIRKKRRLADSVEFFSVQRAEESIRRADLVVFLLDAEAGITEQDKKIGDLITEANKACVVAVNKWDLFEEAVRQKAREQVSTRRKGVSESPLKIFGEWVKEKLFFLDYAPVIFISATAGLHLDRLLEAVRYVAAQMEQKIPTSVLNRVLHEAIERRQPISAAGHFLNFYYATQTNQAPPTFLLFVNRKELIAPQYAKYLCDAMRRAFGYEGCPIVLEARPRPKTVESVRQRGPKRK